MILLDIFHKIITREWVLGICDFKDFSLNGDSWQKKITWIKPSAESWYADPFILSSEGRELQVLVEEFPYVTHKGQISILRIDMEEKKIVESTPLLVLETHLSFPYWFNSGSKIFVIPENSASGGSYIYELDEKKQELTKKRLFAEAPLTDATIFRIGEKQYLISTECPNENSSVLNLYPIVDGVPQVAHKKEIKFEDNTARNAGRVFGYKGKYYRPAQISNSGYGEGICIQEVKSKNNNVSFKEVQRFYSPIRSHNLAFHTFNVFNDDLIIVDAQGYKYGFIGRAIDSIALYFRLWKKRRKFL